MKNSFRFLVLCAAVGLFSTAGNANIVPALGVMDTTHNDPTLHWNPVDFTSPSGAAPFDGTTNGSDLGAGPNLSANWTFSYVIPALTTITSATFTLQMYDADVCTVTPRAPVASFLLAGFDLTSALNTKFQSDPCGTGNSGVSGVTSRTGNINKETINLSGAILTMLLSGSATVSFSLADLGRGVLAADTPHNGGELLYSELNMTTLTTTPSPEPGTWLMMFAGIGALAARRRLSL